jgi:FtsP/CotA-like multicopper oxidase with cupredoxin domain
MSAELFSTDPSGLTAAAGSAPLELADGDVVNLRIAPVAKQLGEATVRMLAYNGSIPGPTLKVRQGSEITVPVVNDGDVEATVHWHGLRLENRYDGVPYQTQPPIPVGGSFTYRVRFPDAGVYWYHPHIREDYTLEMGLYGNIIVAPSEPDYWPPVNREVVLTVDDILLEGGRVAPFSRSEITHTAMGRYGNVLLVSGDPDLSLTAKAGEVVRLYLTNTANTRVFNVRLPGARMKLVGGDSGRYEREAFVEEVLLSPSERAVVDVLFDDPGQLTLEHRTPDRVYRLATVTVTGARATPSLQDEFDVLRDDPELAVERQRLASALSAQPDKILALVGEMDMGGDHGGGHHHMHMTADGIEWEDGMAEMNRMTTTANMRWKLVDRTTGAANAAIDWTFQVGERVKIRLVNEMDSDHPMHHPFHLHGAGRFLVLSRDGAPEPNLVWKDTVLVRTGQVVDILFDVSNPGLWMAHCHIAEHLQSGMMFSFNVTRG